VRAKLDPIEYVFGIGRRSCPGQLLAENTVSTVAANLVALLDTRKVNRKELDAISEYHGKTTMSAILCYELDADDRSRFPKGFPTDAVPVSERTVALLAETCAYLCLLTVLYSKSSMRGTEI
jgi:hypothetical protein